MGFIDELRKLSKGYDEDEDYDDEDVEEEPAPAPTPARTRTGTSRAPAAPVYDYEELGISGAGSTTEQQHMSKVVNIHTTTALQVIITKPDRFDTVSEIAEHLREKHAVVLNLEKTNKDVARRLVDFLSGCAYALDGKIKKIANSTYLITPYNVDIVGDLIDELENNGMYL